MKGRTARADGGKTESPKKGVDVKDTDKGAKWYAGDDSNVKEEAEEPTGFKKGGKVSAFKRGKESEGMKIAGEKAKDRLDRAKRQSGGRIARATGGQAMSAKQVASGSRSPFAVSEKTSNRPGFTGQDVTD
jgi:hypothetical protein